MTRNKPNPNAWVVAKKIGYHLRTVANRSPDTKMLRGIIYQLNLRPALEQLDGATGIGLDVSAERHALVVCLCVDRILSKFLWSKKYLSGDKESARLRIFQM